MVAAPAALCDSSRVTAGTIPGALPASPNGHAPRRRGTRDASQSRAVVLRLAIGVCVGRTSPRMQAATSRRQLPAVATRPNPTTFAACRFWFSPPVHHHTASAPSSHRGLLLGDAGHHGGRPRSLMSGTVAVSAGRLALAASKARPPWQGRAPQTGAPVAIYQLDHEHPPCRPTSATVAESEASWPRAPQE